MIRLTTYSGSGWRREYHPSIANARSAWIEAAPDFGVLTESSRPETVPPAPRPGRLLVSREVVDAYAPSLAVSGPEDGGLLVVADASFDPPAGGEPPPARRRRDGPNHAAAPGAMLLEGWVSLPDDVPLDLLHGSGVSVVRDVLAALRAGTVGDLRALTVADVAPACAAGMEAVQSVRRIMAPWVYEGEGWFGRGSLLDGDYPQWFLDLPLDELRLPRLLGSVLAPCRTIGGLRPHPPECVSRTDGLGPTALGRLRGRVEEALARLSARPSAPAPATPPRPALPAKPRPAGPSFPAYDASTPLADYISGNLGLIKPRDAGIIAERMGLSGPPRTLREMGDAMSLTRERIRQIQERALSTFQRHAGVLSAVKDALAPLAARAPVPLSEVLSQPWSAGLPASFVEPFLLRCAGLHVVSVDLGTCRVDYASTLTGKAWADHERALLELLEATDPRTEASALVAAFSSTIGPGPGRDEAAALATASLAAGVARAQADHAMWRPLVGASLPEHGSAHWGDARDALAALGVDIPEADFLDLVRRYALGIGDGRYAPAPRDPVSDSLLRHCDAVLRSGLPGRRWSAEDILQALRERRARGAAALDAIEVEKVLHASGRYHRSPARLWSAPGRAGSVSSVDEVAARILEEHGGPMPVGELTRRAYALWGGRKTEQLRAKCGLAVLDRGVWGLETRDIVLEPSDRERVVALAASEVAAGRARLDEIFEAIREACVAAGVGNHHLLGTLMRLDRGMVADKSGRLRPASMPPPPREGTFRKSLVEILAARPSGMTHDEISLAVEEATGRTPSVTTVEVAFRMYAVPTGKEGRWVVREEVLGLLAAGGDGPEVARPRRKPVRAASRKPSRPRVRGGYPEGRKRRAPGGPAFDWTPEREAVVRRMLAEGSRPADIRAVLGDALTKCALNAKIFRMGLAKPRSQA